MIVKNVKRARKRRKTNISTHIRFMGVNSAGLRSKLPTFKKVLYNLKPCVLFVQEMKFKTEGKLKLHDI